MANITAGAIKDCDDDCVSLVARKMPMAAMRIARRTAMDAAWNVQGHSWNPLSMHWTPIE